MWRARRARRPARRLLQTPRQAPGETGQATQRLWVWGIRGQGRDSVSTVESQVWKVRSLVLDT